MKARLVRYAPIQMLDYMIERGAVTLAMGFLFGLILVIGEVSGKDNWEQGAEGLQAIRLFFLSTLGLFTWFGALTAVNGIIANDRVKGTVRFLFSKPLSVLHYYAQAWVMHGVGLLIVTSALMALFAIFVRPFFPPGILVFVALTYVLLGGLGFFLSAITKRDGTLLVVTLMLSLALRGRYADESGILAGFIRVLTPPVNEMSTMMASMLVNEPMKTSTVMNSLLYGGICLGLGLLVLRHRAMTT